MTRSRVLAALAVMTFAVVACEDDNQTQVGPVGRTAFDRYVAMGTSVSMGVRNGFNTVTAETQIGAWPSLLARQASARNFRLPLFRPGGCLSPNVAPLSLGINLLGRPQPSPIQPDTICAGLTAGIILPTNNVAITGHAVLQAYTMTPETAAVKLSDCPTPTTCRTDLARRKIMPLVLLPKQTQVTAMTSQKPTFVSVEFGGNDILSIVSGVAIVGATITPELGFDTIYTKIIDSVKTTRAKAILIGLPSAIDSAVALRKGSEIHADSVTFANGFNITVLSNCKTTAADNYIFVPALVFGTIGAARASPTRVPFSCADRGTGVVDYILTPVDIALANATILAYNTRIQALASANEYAYANMDGWFLNAKPVFSVVTLTSGTQPYGKWFGVDGVHPTGAGQIRIANAAIAGINAKYSYTIPSLPNP